MDLTNSDFEAGVATPCAIDEKPATAVDPTNITEASIAEQPFSLTTRNATTAVEARADPDVDVDTGLSVCFPGNCHR
ncbi:hypothetical protein B0E45_13095 [Sinorhizobium sp. A49]|nr:hypothetical protein B0E45_13095 [Sinorhizobium sp. A49]